MKKILLSVLTIALVTFVAVKATGAYFSSTDSSLANSFTTGTLILRIASPSQQGHQVFNVTGLEPGKSVSGCITVVNDGSIPMKWKAYITNGSGDLYQELKLTELVLNSSTCPNPEGLTGYTVAGPANLSLLTNPVSFADLANPISTPLLWDPSKGTHPAAFDVKWAATYKMVVTMDSDADDSFQGKSWTGNLIFYGTQVENTSF